MYAKTSSKLVWSEQLLYYVQLGLLAAVPHQRRLHQGLSLPARLLRIRLLPDQPNLRRRHRSGFPQEWSRSLTHQAAP